MPVSKEALDLICPSFCKLSTTNILTLQRRQRYGLAPTKHVNNASDNKRPAMASRLHLNAALTNPQETEARGTARRSGWKDCCGEGICHHVQKHAKQAKHDKCGGR